LERVVMEVLWERAEPATVREVGRVLAEGREVAPTTVMTVLDRLAKKGLARRCRDGRAWRYAPAASREAYVAELMRDALGLTPDRAAALSRFAAEATGPEAAALRKGLEDAEGPWGADGPEDPEDPGGRGTDRG
jgi:predicted transcriptional regulator